MTDVADVEILLRLAFPKAHHSPRSRLLAPIEKLLDHGVVDVRLALALRDAPEGWLKAESLLLVDDRWLTFLPHEPLPAEPWWYDLVEGRKATKPEKGVAHLIVNLW